MRRTCQRRTPGAGQRPELAGGQIPDLGGGATGLASALTPKREEVDAESERLLPIGQMWVTDPATTSWPSPEHGEVVEIPLGNGTPGLISIPELAELLGSTPRHVRRLVADRRIPYLKIGGKIRFDPVEIALWLDIQRVGSRDDGDR